MNKAARISGKSIEISGCPLNASNSYEIKQDCTYQGEALNVPTAF